MPKIVNIQGDVASSGKIEVASAQDRPRLGQRGTVRQGKSKECSGSSSSGATQHSVCPPSLGMCFTTRRIKMCFKEGVTYSVSAACLFTSLLEELRSRIKTTCSSVHRMLSLLFIQLKT